MEAIKYKILLVEDSPFVIKIHSQMLERIGCIVTVAEDGEKALTNGQDAYDLIFMDINLPKLSGIEVTDRLRQLGVRTPIIGLTAYDKDEVERDCLMAGMNRVLTKPIEEEKLKNVIELCATNSLTF